MVPETSGSKADPQSKDWSDNDDDESDEDPKEPEEVPTPKPIGKSERLKAKHEAKTVSLAVLQTMVEFNTMFESREPRSVKEALAGPNKVEWDASIWEEVGAHWKNGTFEFVDAVPEGRGPISMKHVFKVKQDENGEISQFKTRLVACGNTQTYGVDYWQMDVPCVNMMALQLVLALTARHGWKLFHSDVKTAHLNPSLDEEIYAIVPKALNKYFGKGEGEMVYLRLKKSLYGLKQAGHNWAKEVKWTIQSLGWTMCMYEECIY